MKRYYLQEGDGVHVTGNEFMLVMTNGHLSLSSFDVPALELRFHWIGVPYPVSLDDRGFYIDVDDDTYRALSGLDAPGDADPPPPGFDVATTKGVSTPERVTPNGAPLDGWLQAPSLGSWCALDHNGVMWQMPLYQWEPSSTEPHTFDAARVAEAFEVHGYDEDAYPGAAPDELPDFAALIEIRAELLRLRRR